MGLLQGYSLQQLFFASCLAVVVLISLWETGKKISEILNAYYAKKKKTKDMEKQLQKSVDNDEEHNKAIKALIEITKVQIRHSIVRIAEERIEKGNIGAYELKSLEELYECYGSDTLKGNSYVKDIMVKVRKLPIDTSNGKPNL